MRSFGYLRITTLTSLTHGHANGYQLSLIFIDIFAASSTSLNGLHLQQLPTIRSPRLAALFSPFRFGCGRILDTGWQWLRLNFCLVAALDPGPSIFV